MSRLPDLEPFELEALAYAVEELTEAASIIAKTQRHGLESCHPSDLETPNRELIAKELGDVYVAVRILTDLGIISEEMIRSAEHHKVARVAKYLHHIVIVKENGYGPITYRAKRKP